MVPPGTHFSINMDPLEHISLQNMNSLWKIWTTSQREKNIYPEHISLTKFRPVTYLEGYWGFWKLLRRITSACSTQYTVASSLAEPHTAFVSTCIVQFLWVLHKPNQGILVETYATVNTTNVLSSYFMIVDMLRFALMWVGTNFSEWLQIFQINLFRGEPI